MQNKKYSQQQLLDRICHNLSQYQHFQNRYQPIKNLTNFDDFIDIVTNHIYKTANSLQQSIQKLNRQAQKEKNQNVKTFLLNQVETLKKSVPYNIYKIAGNKAAAKHHAKNHFPLNDFKPIVASNDTKANSFDAIAKINLLSNDSYYSNLIHKVIKSHYCLITSTGSINDSHQIKTRPLFETVEILSSCEKPQNPIQHQVWVTNNLLLKANFKTNETLHDYVDKNFSSTKGLIYLTAYLDEFSKTHKAPYSQETLDNYMAKKYLEYIKRQNENYVEQYLIISIELFSKLIESFKEKEKLSNDNGLFSNLNQLTHIKNKFDEADLKKMQQYLDVRNQLAHPLEYNFRPFGSEETPLDILNNFKSDMVKYLSILLNIPEKDIDAKINTQKEEYCYDVRSLILLMDLRKSLRDLCVTNGNLNPNQKDLFLKLKFITKEENNELTKALNLRNALCHENITSELAQQANQLTNTVAPIINKIKEKAANTYNVHINEYYQPNEKTNIRPLHEIKQEFPFFNLSLNQDEDKKILEDALKSKNNSEPVDTTLLQQLYTFSMLFIISSIERNRLNNAPYFEESETQKISEEYNQLYQKNNKDNLNPPQLVLKAMANFYLKNGKLPQLKKDLWDNKNRQHS